MRSSIACARCRRSKVKCVNSGVGTTCRACETTGRECTYPVPAPGGSGAHRQSSGEVRHPGEGILNHDYPQIQKKPRIKRPPTASHGTAGESSRAIIDALDPSILTPKVWIELFDIWQLHYSADLPFIHPPTFLQALRQMQQAPMSGELGAQRSVPSLMPPASPLILLAFLALTARFNDVLVQHHSPPSSSRPSDPLVACQYYAAAAKSKLAGHAGDSLGLPDSDRIQALAMLALHDWGNCAGQKAWVSLGVAIRYAQVLGLQYQLDLDDEPQSKASKLPHSTPYMGLTGKKGASTSRELTTNFVEEETRRRTFWGLFIMDRYLSSGKYRPQMINTRDVRLQLPSSERSFLFGERVRTSLLPDGAGGLDSRLGGHSRRTSSMHGSSNGDSASTPRQNDERSEDEERLGRWETGSHEGIVSRYIRAMELYGSIIRWSCSGGRRRDRSPPWESSSAWCTMNAQVNNFLLDLPRDLQLSPGNIQAHITSRTSTPFTLLHSVLLLCKIMLHREYIPFIPLRCPRPEGPLDPPLFPPDQYNVPGGFWKESADELFRAARSLIDLVQTCHEWNVLPQTPIVGFAIYIAAFDGVYAINFPWMDPKGHMCKQTGSENESGANAARHGLSLVAMMRRRLKMADGWFKTIHRVHRYYVRIKKDFQRNARSFGPSTATTGPMSIREGGVGGGLEEFKMIESTLQEFGSLEDIDTEMTDAPGSYREESAEAASNGGGNERSPDTGAVRYDRWNAINSGPPQSAPATMNGAQHAMITPKAASPSTSAPGTYKYGGSQASPQVSPTYNQLPPYSSFQTNMQKPQAPPMYNITAPPPPVLIMTAEQTEAWLNSLDTTFSGDDLTAFVEGRDWQTWANDAIEPYGVGGWLSTIWTGAPSM